MNQKLGNISKVEVPHMIRGQHPKPQNFGGEGVHTLEEDYHSDHHKFLLYLSAFFTHLCSGWIWCLVMAVAGRERVAFLMSPKRYYPALVSSMTSCPSLSNYARKRTSNKSIKYASQDRQFCRICLSFSSQQNIRKSLITGGGLGASPLLINFFLLLCTEVVDANVNSSTCALSLNTDNRSCDMIWCFELPDCLPIIHISTLVLRVQQLNVLNNFSKASPIIWSFHSARLSRKSFWEQKSEIFYIQNYMSVAIIIEILLGLDFFPLNFSQMFLLIIKVKTLMLTWFSFPFNKLIPAWYTKDLFLSLKSNNSVMIYLIVDFSLLILTGIQYETLFWFIFCFSSLYVSQSHIHCLLDFLLYLSFPLYSYLPLYSIFIFLAFLITIPSYSINGTSSSLSSL